MKEGFVKHTEEMLRIARDTMQDPALVKETGAVNVKGDRSIEMDVRIEELLIDYVKKNNLPVNVFSEEVGVVSFHPDPKFLVAFDPLDGSTNYKIGKNLLPFGVLIAFYNGTSPKLKDVVAAGAIEYTKGLGWIYDGNKTTDLQGAPVELKQDWAVHRSTPVYLDLYYKEGYKAYSLLPEQIFVRNTGSTIGNLSYLLSNVSAGLGGVSMRAEEIGAVYALVKGAKGVVVNHRGRDLGEESFHPETTYPILAGCQNVIEFCVGQLRVGKDS